MLQKADASNETKIEHLDYFLGVYLILSAYEKEAERISPDFTQLKVDVEAFSVQLKQTLEDAQLNMANEVIELQNAVNICEAELKGYTTTRNGLAIGAGAGVIVGVLAFCDGMVATDILAIVALAGAAITGLIAVGLGIAAAVEHFKVIAARERLTSAIDDDAPALFHQMSIDLATEAYKRLEVAVLMYATGLA
ncbi:hypothetical protein B0H13DRAFT_2350074 [Mycena leptocephala]|nr:hypothetical protein B0H13DRAFT_2350074 [Mycena leptocephala]